MMYTVYIDIIFIGCFMEFINILDDTYSEYRLLSVLIGSEPLIVKYRGQSIKKNID
jgi:hypothetical protein